MLTKRNKTATAALLAALFLSLSFSSCKKKDKDDPTPTDTTGIGTCQPLAVFYSVTHDTLHRYEYDIQGRVSLFTNYNWFGSYKYTSTVNYKTDGSIVIDSRRASASDFREQYFFENGKVVKRLAGSFFAGEYMYDTTYYQWDGGLLKRLRFRVFDDGTRSGDNYNQSIDYVGNLPSTVTEYDLDVAGNETAIHKSTYTYDEKPISFNSFSPFSIAPGLEIVRVDRMYQKIVDQPLGPGGQTHTYEFTNLYDGNKLSQTTVESAGPFITIPSGLVKFNYKCE